ncbi:MAG: sulfotransferase domain-containing protein [Ekhidna sp.]|nr:sulfotransferase domain-containing protein [Ekhidna sp.]
MKTSNLPNFLIIGAQKSGTTSLYQYLKANPLLYFPGQKETHFFTFFDLDDKRAKSLKEYEKLFLSSAEHQLTGEASPSYFTSSNARNHIKLLIPEVKLILILRQPIVRAYSNFMHARREGLESEIDFERAMTHSIEKDLISGNFKAYLEKGLYSKHLGAYLRDFNRDQIHVLFTEDLQKDPQKEIDKCFAFLGVDSIEVSSLETKNPGRVQRNRILVPLLRFYYRTISRNYKKFIPKTLRVFFKSLLTKDIDKLDPSLRTRLTKKYYHEDIKQLENILKVNLSHWFD